MAKKKDNTLLWLGGAAAVVALIAASKKSNQVAGIFGTNISGVKRIIDNTRGRKPKEGERFHLTFETKAGSRYGVYGKTKKECRDKTRGYVVVEEEWDIVEE